MYLYFGESWWSQPSLGGQGNNKSRIAMCCVVSDVKQHIQYHFEAFLPNYV